MLEHETIGAVGEDGRTYVKDFRNIVILYTDVENLAPKGVWRSTAMASYVNISKYGRRQ